MDIEYHPNLEEEILDMLAKEIQQEIDQEIINSMMIEHYQTQGWHFVDVRHFKATSIEAIIEWANEVGLTYLEDVFELSGYFLFKRAEHATMFRLKWV